MAYDGSMTFDSITGAPALIAPGSGFAATISTMNPGPLKEQSSAAWAEILFQLDWLSEPEVKVARVLWLKLPDGEGLKVESWAGTVAVTPGYFSPSGTFLFWDNDDSEFISPASDSIVSPNPAGDIARLIRLARKLKAPQA